MSGEEKERVRGTKVGEREREGREEERLKHSPTEAINTL